MTDKYKIHIIITNPYTDQLYEYDITVYEYTLNEVLDELTTNNTLIINEKTGISIYDADLKYFIFCGNYPLNTLVTIEKTDTLRIKLRPILKKFSLMRMELIEDNIENLDEENQNMFINHKSKRSKERKIGYIIEKVFLWRKLYNGFENDKGNTERLTLEEAAAKVGISKKSLDDYLIQLRIGQQYGFPFNEHKNDKVGVLRAFVKQKKYKENKIIKESSMDKSN